MEILGDGCFCGKDGVLSKFRQIMSKSSMLVNNET